MKSQTIEKTVFVTCFQQNKMNFGIVQKRKNFDIPTFIHTFIYKCVRLIYFDIL